MTLVLALKARDGVVLAADGLAVPNKGIPTRATGEKLGTLHGRLAYGCAGAAGLQQRVRANLESKLAADDCQLPIGELRPKLRTAVNEIQHQASQENPRRQLMGSVAAGIDVLFGGVTNGEPWIYEITADGEDEIHAAAEAIGEGRHYAAYALMSASHYRMHEQELPLVRLLAYRAVNDAIRTDAKGLGEPISVCVAAGGGASLLGEDDKRVLEDELIIWQGHEREVFQSMASAPGSEPDGA
jgi:20S proteasome alpha/beta subunit